MKEMRWEMRWGRRWRRAQREVEKSDGDDCDRVCYAGFLKIQKLALQSSWISSWHSLRFLIYG